MPSVVLVAVVVLVVLVVVVAARSLKMSRPGRRQLCAVGG